MRFWLAALALAVALPSLAQVSTRVRVTGEVQHELTLSADELRRRVVVQERGYGGVRLVDLLGEADIRQDARHALRRTYIVATATDGFQAGVLVAFERDGAPLRDGEGGIALVSLADERPGTRHVKWLERIEVRRVPD
jgi:DMSO/TMAO reductase YedYZ molybdopterin-dependent catalytic subunit